MKIRRFRKCKTCIDIVNQFYDCENCKYAKERNSNEKIQISKTKKQKDNIKL